MMQKPSGTRQQKTDEISALRQRIRELKSAEIYRRRAEAKSQLHRKIAKRLTGQMAVIAETGRMVGATLDIQQVYRRFDIEARRLFPFDRLQVNMKRPDGRFLLVYSSAMGRPGENTISEQDTTAGFAGDTRNSVLIQPKDADEIKIRYPDLYEDFRKGLRSTMSVPLLYMDEVVGNMNFQSKKIRMFSPKDLRLAKKIGVQFAGLLANVHLDSDLQQTHRSLQEIEGQFRLLIENAPDAIFIHADSRFAYLNRAAVRLFGAETAEQLIGTSMLDRFDPAEQEMVVDRYHNLYERNKKFPLTEQIYLRLDGSSVPTEAHGIPFNYNDRNAALIFARDITKRKQAEAAHRSSEQLFMNAFSMSPAIMSILRVDDGRMLEINQMFVHYTGYARDEVIGYNLSELGIFESATLELFRGVASEKDAITNIEIQYTTKAGKRRYGICSAIPIADREEKKILGVLYDITKQKLAEELLRLREEEARRLATNLEEANVALRVLFARREEDQKILEEKIQCNINEIIIPFIRSLKSASLENRGNQYLDLLESNLKSILSPFMRNMGNTYKGLTPKETQIAEMIRQGKNSKDIAEILCSSVATINTHRNSIRKKLRVKNQKTNLRSHLLSLS